MVEQLEKVDPGQMKQDEKLAFWINVYNALMMHVNQNHLLTVPVFSWVYFGVH
jgi:hypothetical protein